MNPANEREERLFGQALEKAPGPERDAFLNGACGADKVLRKRLEALLHAHENPETTLEPKQTAANEVKPTIRLEFPADEGPGTRIGRYKLLQIIGEGGMGVVYMAEQEEPVRRRVALKIIKLGMDTKQVVARFEAERQALALMDHPNIARVLDGGSTESGRPYFVMELVQGVPITEFCDKNKLSARERLKLFIPICQAIQSAHQKGIIHRDLKPSNVLVTLNHGEPVPKVIDFGIAKATSQKLTEKTLFTNYGSLIGTPAYMSPEQAEMSSLDVDTRADVYSLGVLLYELLTGSTPFPEKRLRSLGYGEMQRVIIEEEPERPSTRLSTMDQEQRTAVVNNRGEQGESLHNLLKGDLDWVVMKCLEKDRRRRYETANGLARDIERHMSDEPVTARPPSAAYKFQKAWQRNKVVFTSGAVVLAALVFGITISTWQAIVASRAKNAEQQQKIAAQSERDKALTSEKAANAAKQAEANARLRADVEKAEAFRNLYVANMNLAQQAWEENNMDGLRQLLEDTKDYESKGFEWYYWEKQSHLALLTLRGHLGVLADVAFSPDGRRILTSGEDGTARLWDAVSGRELFSLKGHTQYAVACFSPDGEMIVTGGAGGTAKIWQAATGREISTIKWPDQDLVCLDVSSDGQKLVGGSGDGNVCVWELHSGRRLLAFIAHDQGVASVKFSPDGQKLLSCSYGSPVKVWDVATASNLVTLPGRTDDVTGAGCFSPDGTRIAVASARGAIVWDAISGREIAEFKGLHDWVNSVAFSPDGRIIATAGWDGTARLWDILSGQEICTLRGHGSVVDGLAFSPDGRRIVSSSYDGTAKVWDAAITQRHSENDQTNWPNVVSLSPDAKLMAVKHINEQKLKICEAATGRELAMLDGGTPATFSRDGRKIAVSGDHDTLRVCETSDGRALISLQEPESGVRCVAFSPNGMELATGGRDRMVRLWNLATGDESLTLEGRVGDTPLSIAYSPDGKQVAAGGRGELALWDRSSGHKLATIHESSVGGFDQFSFCPDGRRIVASGYPAPAGVWELESGRELFDLKGESDDCNVVFSADGRRIISANHKGLRIWDGATGRHLLSLETSGKTDINSRLATTMDGSSIVAIATNGSCLVWNAAPDEEVAVWQAEESAARKLIEAARAEQRRASEAQEIARQRKSIKRWLLLGPVPLPDRMGLIALTYESIEGEDRLTPQNGDSILSSGHQLTWRKVSLSNPEKSLDDLLGGSATNSVAYAVCYLRTPRERSDLKLMVSEDCVARVYLNSKTVYEDFSIGHGGTVHEPPSIDLKTGLNLLVLKLVNASAGWGKANICLTDELHNPAEGVEFLNELDSKEIVEPSVLDDNKSQALQCKAEDLAILQRWQAAAEKLAQAVEEDAANPEYWYQLAPLLVKQGDGDGYRRHVAEMLSRFGDVRDPMVAVHLATAALLQPCTDKALDSACRMAERALTLEKGRGRQAEFDFAEGLAEYRKGNYTNSIDWLQRAITRGGIYGSDRPAPHLILAMAKLKIGDMDGAHLNLKLGSEDLHRGVTSQYSSMGRAINDWCELVVASVLQDEANKLIGSAPDK